MSNALHHGMDHLAETLADVKPKLRGWLHLATAPLTLAAGIVLIALSPDTLTRVGSAVFTGSAVLLFTVSAIYHRGGKGAFGQMVHAVVEALLMALKLPSPR